MIHISLKNTLETVECTPEEFEELLGVKYLPRLTFADWKVERWLRKRCARAYRRGQIGQLAEWLGKLHGKALDEARFPDVTIRWIGPEIGYGLFTNRPFKKWEFIGEYSGVVRRRNLIFRNINDYCFMYPKAWRSLKAFTIDSEKEGNHTRFINHRDHPNCESVGVFHDGVYHILFRTIEEIPAHTELTYDYGEIYWNRRKKLPDS